MSLCGTNNKQTTEDRATQPMEAGGWVSQLQPSNKTFGFLLFKIFSEMQISVARTWMKCSDTVERIQINATDANTLPLRSFQVHFLQQHSPGNRIHVYKMVLVTKGGSRGALRRWARPWKEKCDMRLWGWVQIWLFVSLYCIHDFLRQPIMRSINTTSPHIFVGFLSTVRFSWEQPSIGFACAGSVWRC